MEMTMFEKILFRQLSRVKEGDAAPQAASDSEPKIRGLKKGLESSQEKKQPAKTSTLDLGKLGAGMKKAALSDRDE